MSCVVETFLTLFGDPEHWTNSYNLPLNCGHFGKNHLTIIYKSMDILRHIYSASLAMLYLPTCLHLSKQKVFARTLYKEQVMEYTKSNQYPICWQIAPLQMIQVGSLWFSIGLTGLPTAWVRFFLSLWLGRNPDPATPVELRGYVELLVFSSRSARFRMSWPMAAVPASVEEWPTLTSEMVQMKVYMYIYIYIHGAYG